MCSRWWACPGSVHAFEGLVVLPALAFSPVALGVSGHCATALARSLVQLPVRLPCALCGVLRGLLGSSGTHFPGWFGGPSHLAKRSHGCWACCSWTSPSCSSMAETAGGVMTKFIARNTTVPGALNSDVSVASSSCGTLFKEGCRRRRRGFASVVYLARGVHRHELRRRSRCAHWRTILDIFFSSGKSSSTSVAVLSSVSSSFSSAIIHVLARARWCGGRDRPGQRF